MCDDQRRSEGPRPIEAAGPERARKAQGHQAIEQIARLASWCRTVDWKPVVPPVRWAFFFLVLLSTTAPCGARWTEPARGVPLRQKRLISDCHLAEGCRVGDDTTRLAGANWPGWGLARLPERGLTATPHEPCQLWAGITKPKAVSELLRTRSSFFLLRGLEVSAGSARPFAVAPRHLWKRVAKRSRSWCGHLAALTNRVAAAGAVHAARFRAETTA